METQAVLNAEIRTQSGKGEARKLRSRGLIPAVFYGPKTDARSIAVSPRDLLKALDNPHGRNTVLGLKMGDQDGLALVKDIDVDPVTAEPLHVDFYQVEPGRTVDVDVPFKTKGRAVGVQKGGTLHVTLRSLPVRAAPENIPARIVVDVTRMDIGAVVRVENLELAEGVSVLREPHTTLVTVMSEEKKRGRGEEETAEEVTPKA
jgi:large subunit ribosomal protein L25